MKTKHNVCVKLTEKNCKKVLGILEMFGEPIYEGDRVRWKGGVLYKGDCFATIDKFGDWRGLNKGQLKDWYSDNIKTLVKSKELKQILAVEHLKEGDIIVARIDSVNGAIDYITSFSHFHETGFSGKNWVCLDSKTLKINTGTGSFDKFLRFATDEEKALLDPKKEPETITKEAWVTIGKNGTFFAYHSKEVSKLVATITGEKVVKGTLTYTLDND